MLAEVELMRDQQLLAEIFRAAANYQTACDPLCYLGSDQIGDMALHGTFLADRIEAVVTALEDGGSAKHPALMPFVYALTGMDSFGEDLKATAEALLAEQANMNAPRSSQQLETYYYNPA